MNELDILKSTIRKAGQAAMAFYDSGNEINYKEGEAPVTKADLASEAALLEGLKPFNYGILSEETDEENDRLNKQKVWIIDPLDGTKDFIQKTGDFTVIAGLVENGQVILGAVYQPAIDKLYYAVKGQGAFFEHEGQTKQIHVSELNDLSEFKMLASRNHLQEAEVQFAEQNSISNFVKSGSAGLKACLVAEGKGDIYMNTSDKTYEWDICGASLIVEEAGGKITDMMGESFVFNKKDPRNKKGFVVSNGKIHDKIIENRSGL
jgi:3'(2'), 5'-bisphosphate nucleotidase